MRKNYLYFKPGHGFVGNIYDFPSGSKSPSHFLKFHILKHLIDNRKKMGDTRYEGYFTAEYICKIMGSLGFDRDDVIGGLNALLADELIMSEALTLAPVDLSTAVRVRSSGYIHQRILAQRTEYIASCALITSISDEKVANRIGTLWQINNPHIDAKGRSKREAASLFVDYLKERSEEHHGRGVGLAESEKVGAQMMHYASEALGFSPDQIGVVQRGDAQEKEYDRLFDEGAT